MTYIPYSQIGLVKIQPNGYTEEKRDLRPSYNIMYHKESGQTIYRMLSRSILKSLWMLLLRFLGKKWPDEE